MELGAMLDCVNEEEYCPLERTWTHIYGLIDVDFAILRTLEEIFYTRVKADMMRFGEELTLEDDGEHTSGQTA